MSVQFPTVDADGHLEEVHINWKERVSEKYRSMAPEQRPASDSHLRLMLEGKPWPKPSGFGLGVGGPYRRPHPRREGMKDPKARLVDMDSEGIEIAVLFGGGIGGTIPALEDIAFAAELARARNTWVAEYCSANPARLRGTAVLPQQDTAAAVAELTRTVTELGFVGVSLLPNLRGRHMGDPDFFPIYKEAERLNVPICVHMFLGRYGSEATGTMRVDKFFYSHLFGHTFEQMIALAVVLGEGLLDRFPKLRFVFLESGAGWLPYWFYRLDEHYEVLGNQVPELKTMPSKLLERGQLYFSCEADETEIPRVIETIGDDWIVFASDYSHFDSRFPGASEPIIENKQISDASKRKILNDNARRLYPLG
jgi:predicted TIM-barrel fold metal-dependent hydrolase